METRIVPVETSDFEITDDGDVIIHDLWALSVLWYTVERDMDIGEEFVDATIEEIEGQFRLIVGTYTPRCCHGFSYRDAGENVHSYIVRDYAIPKAFKRKRRRDWKSVCRKQGGRG